MRTMNGLLETLNNVKDTFDTLEPQLRSLHAQGAEIRVRLDMSAATLAQLDRVVRLGNGVPSLLTTVAQLRDRQERLESELRECASKEEVGRVAQRMVASGKATSRVIWAIVVPVIVGVITAVVTSKLGSAQEPTGRSGAAPSGKDGGH